ncbi:M15 family metallopeptidase [Marinimicrobium sp. ABcell2]|uniref:M15 family metallopeptidase n=1 Tax=Marinimicrobium sp. ABcell2 TaxID=3069751 RepID=UPI0027AFA180|nr:M15 family metallopeptidase [Marinimicrobium sp. ABcell2]MDQ2077685.1 M15 family metallopeptidase [Marinimicrobium sp. ABcell2]
MNVPPVDRLCGLITTDLVTLERWSSQLHSALLTPLQTLDDAATEAGFRFEVASGFRSFERQLGIWNAKARGERPVLNDQGEPLDISRLSERECVFAILRWSALPGTSRHHWGTDLDVYDSSRFSPGYRLQLTLDETQGQGPCADFHAWLSDYLCSPSNPGFFRPYDRERGGVAPEPWHLSYAPESDLLAAHMTADVVRPLLVRSELLLKNAVLDNLEEIVERFVRVPGPSGTR